MKLPRRQFLHLAAGAPRCRPSHASLGRKPIRRGRCASSSALPPAVRPTSSRASWVNGCRKGSANNSLSKTDLVLAATSAPKWWCGHPRMATRSSWWVRRTRSMPRSMISSVSISFAISRRSRASVANAIVMVVHPSFPAKTVPEFIAYAKANPGKVTMASPGNGSSPHVSGELFKMMAGIDMIYVPYRGGGQVMTDLIAGQVQVSFIGLTVAIEHIRSGKLRALAVTTATRSDVLPDIMPFPIHPHMLRHSVGYKLVNEGHDTWSIAHYLGHRNLQSTARYTALAPDQFKDFFRD